MFFSQENRFQDPLTKKLWTILGKLFQEKKKENFEFLINIVNDILQSFVKDFQEYFLGDNF